MLSADDLPPGNGSPSVDASQPGLDQSFDATGLAALRAAVAAHGSDLGLPEERSEDLVIVAHELAINAIRHGGGKGRLRLWREGGQLRCQVTDSGQGMSEPETTGLVRPDSHIVGGRGVWLVRQMCARVDIEAGPSGTTVTVALDLG